MRDEVAGRRHERHAEHRRHEQEVVLALPVVALGDVVRRQQHRQSTPATMNTRLHQRARSCRRRRRRRTSTGRAPSTASVSSGTSAASRPMPAIDDMAHLAPLRRQHVDQEQHDDRDDEHDLGRERVPVDAWADEADDRTDRRHGALNRPAACHLPSAARLWTTEASVTRKMKFGYTPSTRISDQHRRPGDVVGDVHVVDVRIRELAPGRAEGNPLEQPQQVAGGEDRADGGDHHERAEQHHAQAGRRVVGRQDRRELAPEPGETGQAERRHTGRSRGSTPCAAPAAAGRPAA